MLAKVDLIEFARRTHPNYQANWHHRKIANALQCVEEGKIDRLMIFMPPRHGKSELASVRFPVWYLGKNPTKRVISASYTKDLATDFGRQTRNLVMSPKFQILFPTVNLAKDSFSVQKWDLNTGGGFTGTGVGGTITGRGADIFIIDDPIKSSIDADSKAIRDNIDKWYRDTAYNRLEKGGKIILIMTRWHHDDIAGRLIKQMEEDGDDWHLVQFPAEAMEQEEFRKEGDPLWEDKYNTEALERIKKVSGSRTWSALYQQTPQLEEHALFKREYWKFYEKGKLPHVYRYVWSWDTAYKAGERNDYSVGTFWAETESGYYLIDVVRGKWEYPDLKRQMILSFEKNPSSAVLLEDAASGQSIYQELYRTTKLPLIRQKVDKSKLVRADVIQPIVEAGKVFLPRNAHWVNDFIDETVMFPVGRYDDQVDSMTQALAYLNAGQEVWVEFI